MWWLHAHNKYIKHNYLLYAYHTSMVNADNSLGSPFEKNEMKWNRLNANILMASISFLVLMYKFWF